MHDDPEFRWLIAYEATRDVEFADWWTEFYRANEDPPINWRELLAHFDNPTMPVRLHWRTK